MTMATRVTKMKTGFQPFEHLLGLSLPAGTGQQCPLTPHQLLYALGLAQAIPWHITRGPPDVDAAGGPHVSMLGEWLVRCGLGRGHQQPDRLAVCKAEVA